jgi:hypothetical protein
VVVVVQGDGRVHGGRAGALWQNDWCWLHARIGLGSSGGVDRGRARRRRTPRAHTAAGGCAGRERRRGVTAVVSDERVEQVARERPPGFCFRCLPGPDELILGLFHASCDSNGTGLDQLQLLPDVCLRLLG